MDNITNDYGTSGKQLLSLMLSILKSGWESLSYDGFMFTISDTIHINRTHIQVINNMRNYGWRVTTLSNIRNNIHFKLEPDIYSGIFNPRIYLDDEEHEEDMLGLDINNCTNYGFEDVD